MPHGIYVDSKDNVWVTDVAMHQVRFNCSNSYLNFIGVTFRLIRLNIGPELISCIFCTRITTIVFFQVFRFPKNSSTIDLMLGQRFQPGSEDNCFCKPADVTVTSSGEVFVADG